MTDEVKIEKLAEEVAEGIDSDRTYRSIARFILTREQALSDKLSQVEKERDGLVEVLITLSADKLRTLASWFDVDDAEKGRFNKVGGCEVQRDLRQWADTIDKALNQPK